MQVHNFKDLTGMRFERLVVICRDENDRWGQAKWKCKCDCGNEVSIVGASLRNSVSKSCGCWNADSIKNRSTKHGESGSNHSQEYSAWQGMIGRCENPNNQKFISYGGRGISVCKRWRENYENFLADMGRCPKQYSLDRIDVNGNYEPDNCRWTTASVQSFNKRVQKNSTTGIRGISHIKNNKYRAHIGHNHHKYNLGTFNTLEEAIAVRLKAEKQYYGI